MNTKTHSAGLWVLPLAALIFSMSFPAVATDVQDENAQEKPAPSSTLDIDYNKIEGLGLYQKSSEGSLGRNLWEHSKRSSIVALLEKMPVTSETPEVNAMIFGILLSEADPNSIENDVQPEPGRDLLTLRLEKLIEAGAYSQAFALYDKLGEEKPYHERLAHAGILAMLYNGEKSLACLETNILRERFTGEKLWNTLAAYCDANLSEKSSPESLAVLEKFSGNNILPKLATDKEYRFAYDRKAFQKLEPLERALLAAEERLDAKQIFPGDEVWDGPVRAGSSPLQEIPAAHLQPLLKARDLKTYDKILLTIRAVKLGLKAPEFLEKLYIAEAKAEADNPEEWTKVFKLYDTAKNQKDKAEQWKTLRQALPLAKLYGPEAFIPYAKLLQQTEPDAPTLDDIVSFYRIMRAAGLEVPNTWIKAYPKTCSEQNNVAICAKIAAVNAITEPGDKNIKENFVDISSALQKNGSINSLILNGTLNYIIPKSINNDINDDIYVKEFYLTSRLDYVMHSGVVWDRLLETSNAKAVGETILLNIILLHDRSLQQIYPRLLRDILRGAENVGLTSVSENLAIKASLGDE